LLSDVPALGELELMGEVAARLEGLARRLKPHVLHAHSPVLNAIPALRVGRRLGIPVVYEVRASWEDAAVDHGTTHEKSLRYRLSRGLETYAVKRSDHVVTICEGLRVELAGRGVPAQKITVVPNGVDIERFASAGARDSTLAGELGLAECTVLGFVGSFYGYEGLQLLIEALPRMLAVRPDVRVLLVGGGVQEESLRRQAAELGLAEKVRFTGRVAHDEVHRYYDLIDILVYPRLSMRLTELVTPLKPLEAMAQGRLVVASDVGGHRELMTDGVTAKLFRAGDVEALSRTVLELIDDKQSWPRLREQARRYVEQERTWEASAARYQPIYSGLVEAWPKSA
jgi:PEP-CTERM/exosortase A-associated glycosyltransferase